MRSNKRVLAAGRKLFAVILAALLILPYSATAKIRIPSASQMAGELEQRYHVNVGSIQNMGEGFNVSANKPIVPEVSLFFSPTDPRVGEKITAKALPMYFSNPKEQLYYTWFLKRKGCDLTNTPTADQKAKCDSDSDNNITTNDWKVAAAKIIVQNGYNNTRVVYGGVGNDADKDGFQVIDPNGSWIKNLFGGVSETKRRDWCYVYDPDGGKLYELASGGGSFSGCDPANGSRPVCITPTTDVESGCSYNVYGIWTCGDWSMLTDSASTSYYISGSPTCSGGVPTCTTTGALPRCVGASVLEPLSASSGSALGVCSSGTPSPQCPEHHLFPSTNGNGVSGDGSFSDKEEQFWGTDPSDSDTSDSGMKDESMVIGVGIDSFTWNYDSGDKVGVAIEGTTPTMTKHDDSSSMVMWAFSNNKCVARDTGGYSTIIRGYSVYIPTSSMNINSCVSSDALVDPLGGEGQPKKLDVGVTYTPDNPVNDTFAAGFGDTLTAIATVGNSSRSSAELLYEWKVELSDSVLMNGAVDITNDLLSAGLISATKGNGMDSLSIALNMQNAILGTFASDDPIYLRVSAIVSENYDSAVVRSGRSDAIVKVSNTSKWIQAFSTNTYDDDPSPNERFEVSTNVPICNTFTANPTTEAQIKENLNRIACRVTKNEIIGLRVNATGLTNFQWSINGEPLLCSKESVSNQCAASGEQNEYAFFAVAGNVGETYAIRLSANDVTTGKAVELSRTFNVVDPIVSIESADQSLVWPKFLGAYTNNSGTISEDYSDELFEALKGQSIHLRALSYPSYAINLAQASVWSIDGVPAVIDGVLVDPASGITVISPTEIKIPANKNEGDLYNVSFSTDFIQGTDKRKSLEQMWGISAIGSSEIRSSSAIRVSVIEDIEIAATGVNKFYAAVSQYLPSSVVLSIKLMLTIGLLIFTMSFVFALIPETSGEEVILSRRRD